MSSHDTLQKILDLLRSEPHAASALTLYALANTLEFPKAGYLFKLDKLKGLAPEHRQLAYQLIELMVEDQVGTPEWQRAKAQMDDLVRGG